MQRNLNINTTDKYLCVPKCVKHTRTNASLLVFQRFDSSLWWQVLVDVTRLSRQNSSRGCEGCFLQTVTNFPRVFESETRCLCKPTTATDKTNLIAGTFIQSPAALRVHFWFHFWDFEKIFGILRVSLLLFFSVPLLILAASSLVVPSIKSRCVFEVQSLSQSYYPLNSAV